MRTSAVLLLLFLGLILLSAFLARCGFWHNSKFAVEQWSLTRAAQNHASETLHAKPQESAPVTGESMGSLGNLLCQRDHKKDDLCHWKSANTILKKSGASWRDTNV